MAEEAIDYEAQEQARQETYQRERHAALLAMQRQAPEPANDATPVPANDGDREQSQEDFVSERTQARLAAKRAKNKNETEETGSKGTGGFGESSLSDDVDDLALLTQAVIGFFALIPPLCLFLSYHLRLLGGNIGVFSKELFLPNFALEKMVGMSKAKGGGAGGGSAAGGKSLSGSAKGFGDQFSGSLNQVANTADIGSLLNQQIASLKPWQIIVLVLAYILLFLGALLPFMPLLMTVGAIGGTAFAIISSVCSYVPGVCDTISSLLF